VAQATVKGAEEVLNGLDYDVVAMRTELLDKYKSAIRKEFCAKRKHEI
jgi:hypothetical protein